MSLRSSSSGGAQTFPITAPHFATIQLLVSHVFAFANLLALVTDPERAFDGSNALIDVRQIAIEIVTIDSATLRGLLVQTLELPISVPAEINSDIELKVAATRTERNAAFELIYNSYRRAGLCAEKLNGVRFTPYQLLPTTDIIVARLRGEVISTLSLVRDGELGLPMEEIFADEVASRRAAGRHLAEVSGLADRRQSPARFFALFCNMSRLMAQLAIRLGVTELLVTVHPRHAPLYRRFMAFRPLGDCREYPTVQGNPAVALSLDFSRAQVESPKSWQEFFGSPLPRQALCSCPLSDADRDYFLSLSDEDCKEESPLVWPAKSQDVRSAECTISSRQNELSTVVI